MPMKRLPIISFLSCALIASSANAAVVIYNQNTPPDNSGLPSGGWGTYRGFSVNFSDVALSTSYTAGETSTPATINLTQLAVRHAGSQGSPPNGNSANALLKVYTTQSPTQASFVGDSTNRNDLTQTGTERTVTFDFAQLSLNTSQTYYFILAETEGDGSSTPIEFTGGRLRVSNDANHNYSGNLISATYGTADAAFDAIFAATFVPEPSAALLGALGVLGLLRRRR